MLLATAYARLPHHPTMDLELYNILLISHKLINKMTVIYTIKVMCNMYTVLHGFHQSCVNTAAQCSHQI